MYAEIAWVLVSSGTQVILDPDYLSDYLSDSYDYVHSFSLTFKPERFNILKSEQKNERN